MLTPEQIAEIEAGCDRAREIGLRPRSKSPLKLARTLDEISQHLPSIETVRELCRLARIGIEAQASHHKDNSHER